MLIIIHSILEKDLEKVRFCRTDRTERSDDQNGGSMREGRLPRGERLQCESDVGSALVEATGQQEVSDFMTFIV